MPSALVIFIGNASRGDDGVAHLVAKIIGEQSPDGTRLLGARQLDVVMADELQDAETVVFVDAERRESPPVEVRRIEARPHGEHGHALAPGHLLEVAYALYSVRPRAWLVSVAAPEMEHSQRLSDTALQAAPAAAAAVLELLRA